jgi:hypothetical protein
MSRATRVLAAAVALGAWLSPAQVAGEPIAPGTGKQTASLGATNLVVYTYRPANCADPTLLLVFHGAQRNARDYRDDARALANQLCMVVVAPLFDRQTYPGWRYQFGGIVKDGVVQDERNWTGRLALDLVAWVRAQEGRPLAYSLLGHSGGSQFLDRLAAFVPTEARRIVIANPGSYVLPSLDVEAPFGLGKVFSGAAGETHLQRYLGLPLTVYLGERDTRVDDDDRPQAKAQGASRYARGVSTFNAAQTLAQARGWTLGWRLVRVPGIGHDARKMFAAPQAVEALTP